MAGTERCLINSYGINECVDTSKHPSMQVKKTLALHLASLGSPSLASFWQCGWVIGTNLGRARRSPGSKKFPLGGEGRGFSEAEGRKQAFASLESSTKGPGVNSALHTVVGTSWTAVSRDLLVVTPRWHEQPLPCSSEAPDCRPGRSAQRPWGQEASQSRVVPRRPGLLQQGSSLGLG